MAKKVRIAAIGLGNRMHKYLSYVELHPEKAEVVAVADPDELRLRKYAEKFRLKDNACFPSHEGLYASDIEADMVIISSPDRCHYAQAMGAIARGCGVLLEKPVAQTIEQVRDVAKAAKEAGVLVNVCYVLRYYPFYMRMKEILDSGKLGKILGINHLIKVGKDRMTHSYVRGTFSHEETATPLVLAKASHDTDLMLWLLGKNVKSVTSTGSLTRFRLESAPEGSTDRCVDCPLETSCPYSAVDLYQRRGEWIKNFDVPEGMTRDEVIAEEMRSGRYGRCAFRCDNNVLDYQTVDMQAEDGVQMSLKIDGLSYEEDRETDIICSKGRLYTCGDIMVVERKGKEEIFNYSNINHLPLHAGADFSVIENTIDAIADPSLPLRASIVSACPSHEICFAAERSRHASGAPEYL